MKKHGIYIDKGKKHKQKKYTTTDICWLGIFFSHIV